MPISQFAQFFNFTELNGYTINNEISNSGYEHAHKIWHAFRTNTTKDYH